MGIAIGDDKLVNWAIGAKKVKGAAIGAVLVYRNLTAGRMDKSGTTTLAANTDTKVPNWTPTSGSVESNNALIVQGSGPIVVTWRGVWSNTLGTKWFELRRNGTVIGTRFNGGNDTGAQTINGITAADGDALELWARSNLSSSVVQASSYVSYAPA